MALAMNKLLLVILSCLLQLSFATELTREAIVTKPIQSKASVFINPDAWSKLPADVQICILFDFLRPVETLRMRVISRQHRELINTLAKLRVFKHCLSLSGNLPLKRLLALSVNHLSWLQAVFPLPLPASVSEADAVGLFLFSYFRSIRDVDELKKRLLRFKYYCTPVAMFYYAIPSAKDRLQVFKPLSRLFHELELTQSLAVLYDYCRGSNEAIKSILFTDKCKYLRDEDDLHCLLDDYFNVLSPAVKLNLALDSQNHRAVSFLLDYFNLSLPETVHHLHILRYLTLFDIHSADLVSFIDFAAIPTGVYKECLMSVLSFRQSSNWLLSILQHAPIDQLPPVFMALKIVFVFREIPLLLASASELAVLLAAIGRDDYFALEVFRQCLPNVEAPWAPIITCLAADKEPYARILMLQNDHFAPKFRCPKQVKFVFEGDQLKVEASKEERLVFPTIAAVLKTELVQSKWFNAAYLMTIGSVDEPPHSSLLYYFTSVLLGHEVVDISLPDLQKRVTRFEWFTPDFIAINAEKLLTRTRWSLLELAIVFYNPVAVQICLDSAGAREFLKANRLEIVGLARLMRGWAPVSDEYQRRSDAILTILEGGTPKVKTIEVEEMEEKKMEEYLITDPYPVVPCESIPPP